MNDKVENLLLEHMRALRAKQDEFSTDMQVVKSRLTNIELSLAAMRRENAGDAESIAHAGARVDRLEERLARIEKRLELRDQGE
ncbi:MAG: hypothetical protein RIM84_08310 [Alphaproteobacteria bacterium]